MRKIFLDITPTENRFATVSLFLSCPPSNPFLRPETSTAVLAKS